MRIFSTVLNGLKTSFNAEIPIKRDRMNAYISVAHGVEVIKLMIIKAKIGQNVRHTHLNCKSWYIRANVAQVPYT